MLLALAKETVEMLRQEEKDGVTCCERLALERKLAPPVRDLCLVGVA